MTNREWLNLLTDREFVYFMRNVLPKIASGHLQSEEYMVDWMSEECDTNYVELFLDKRRV